MPKFCAGILTKSKINLDKPIKCAIIEPRGNHYGKKGPHHGAGHRGRALAFAQHRLKSAQQSVCPAAHARAGAVCRHRDGLQELRHRRLDGHGQEAPAHRAHHVQAPHDDDVLHPARARHRTQAGRDGQRRTFTVHRLQGILLRPPRRLLA